MDAHIFLLSAEARGNERGNSVDFRGCCHGLQWKSAGFHGKCHGLRHFHGKCHGCGHGTCRGSVRGKLRRTNHGNPRNSAAIVMAVFADVQPQQFPPPSAAVRGHCHGNPPIVTLFDIFNHFTPVMPLGCTSTDSIQYGLGLGLGLVPWF